MLFQTIILGILISGAIYARSQIILAQEELDRAISNINDSFQEIIAVLPKLESTIDIVLSLAESLIVLENIKDALTLIVGG